MSCQKNQPPEESVSVAEILAYVRVFQLVREGRRDEAAAALIDFGTLMWSPSEL